MEDFDFDIGGILTEEEANKLFEENAQEPPQPEETEEQPKDETVEEEETEQVETPEEVDGEEEDKNQQEDTGSPEDDGSSPDLYPSIARAFKDDGIFPDLEDSEIEAAKTPEAFAELIEKVIDSRVDERTNRVNQALSDGVAPDQVRMYEQTIQYLSSINNEVLAAEGEDGEALRRQLIYNDLINRGYSEDKAKKEIEKSFNAGSDVEDATDALEALKKYYNDGYDKVRSDARKAAEEAKNLQKKQSEDFKKMVLEDEIKLGDTVLDKKTCQRVFDAVSKPVYKDKEGRLLTAVQKYQSEHPLEFLKQLGMWFVLTEGGKNMTGFTKETVQKEKNKSVRELANKISAGSITKNGNFRYPGAGSEAKDPLLSDDWRIGF